MRVIANSIYCEELNFRIDLAGKYYSIKCQSTELFFYFQKLECSCPCVNVLGNAHNCLICPQAFHDFLFLFCTWFEINSSLMTTKQTSEGIHLGFETQDSHHKKSKSVVPQEGLISHKNSISCLGFPFMPRWNSKQV